MSSPAAFDRVVVVGLGLIGGSVAHALASRWRVVGVDVDAPTCADARADGIETVDDVRDAAGPGALVVVAVPVPCIGDVFAALAACECRLVTDVASVKQPVLDSARRASLRFVGGHPMAGRELAGYRAASDSLFEGARWALCLDPGTAVQDMLDVATLVLGTGASVVPTVAAEHDRAVALVSHLPHVLAAALAAAAGDDTTSALAFGLAAGSFRDGTRVARSPAPFWAGIAGENAENLGAVVRDVAGAFGALAGALDTHDRAVLEAFFARRARTSGVRATHRTADHVHDRRRRDRTRRSVGARHARRARPPRRIRHPRRAGARCADAARPRARRCGRRAVTRTHASVPPHPNERLAALRGLAAAQPGGLVDCTIGSPCDPVPAVAVAAATAALSQAAGYPMSPGSLEYRGAWARYFARRFGAVIAADAVAACPGTKELIAALPAQLRAVLGDRAHGRDVVLVPGLAYATYADGAAAAGCRAVPVPPGARWEPDLGAVTPGDAERALLLWLNTPANPTGACMDRAGLDAAIAWGRERGIVVASDECYLDLVDGAPTVLGNDHDGLLAVHSLSKRSNFAGMRAGCYAGDAQLVAGLAARRRTLGLIVPTPVQVGAVAALDDDSHVVEQRARYEGRKAMVLAGLGRCGIVHDGGAMPFYLWLRDASAAVDGWTLAERFARSGWLVTPGATFGAAGAAHVRLALVQPDHVLQHALERFTEREGR